MQRLSELVFESVYPCLKHLNDPQVVFLKKLEVAIPMDPLVRQLQMLYVHASLPKEPLSEFIVMGMRACFPNFR